jgi:dTMP kinase
VLPDAATWIRGIHDDWTIIPDRTYLLTIPIEEALKRLTEKKNREHFERESTLVQVQAEYLNLASQDPSRFVVIDAMQKKEKIVSFVAEDLRRCSEQ